MWDLETKVTVDAGAIMISSDAVEEVVDVDGVWSFKSARKPAFGTFSFSRASEMSQAV